MMAARSGCVRHHNVTAPCGAAGGPRGRTYSFSGPLVQNASIMLPKVMAGRVRCPAMPGRQERHVGSSRGDRAATAGVAASDQVAVGVAAASDADVTGRIRA